MHNYWEGVDYICRTVAGKKPIVSQQMIITKYVMVVEWYWQGKTRVMGGGIYPNATLFTTNHRLTALGMNPGPCGEKLVTKHLSYGTAMHKL